MDPLQDASTLERQLLRRAAQTRTPLHGSLELLPLCNMNCDMCYVRLSPAELAARGRLRTADEWLALGRQMQQAGVLFLLLTGGEPLLFPEFRRLYGGLKELGMHLTVNTNATLLDEDWADFFAAHKPRRVNITLYGADDRAYAELCHCPGGFAKATAAVRLLRARGVDVKLSGSLTPANRGDLDRLLALGEALGVPVRIDTYMMPAARERGRPFDGQARLDPVAAARARVRALKAEMEPGTFAAFVRRQLFLVDNALPGEGPGRVSCLAGRCSFTVNWQGEMRPCVVMDRPAAPVFTLGFLPAWQQIAAATGAIRLSETCHACRLRPLCRTCAAGALLETGRWDGVPDYMCRYAGETHRLLRLEAEALGDG